MKKSIKIGLALGGGGALGIAHIGALQVLEENDIPIDMIAGTSMGAIVGLLYSAGVSLDKIQEEALKLRTLNLYSPNFKFNGLSNGTGVMRWIKKLTSDAQFKDLKIPFQCVAVELISGKEKAFKTGSTTTAVRASFAVPSMFSPVEIGKKVYVDGGVLNNVPDDVVRAMGADFVIAIDPISEYQTYGKVAGFIEPIMYSYFLLQKKYNELKPKNYDFLVKPSQIGLKQFTFSKKSTLASIQAGRLAMEKAIPEIKQLLEEKMKECEIERE